MPSISTQTEEIDCGATLAMDMIEKLNEEQDAVLVENAELRAKLQASISERQWAYRVLPKKYWGRFLYAGKEKIQNEMCGYRYDIIDGEIVRDA
jgi:hypothetical protein